MVRRIESPLDAAREDDQPRARCAREVGRQLDDGEGYVLVKGAQPTDWRRHRAGEEQDGAGDEGREREEPWNDDGNPVASGEDQPLDRSPVSHDGGGSEPDGQDERRDEHREALHRHAGRG